MISPHNEEPGQNMPWFLNDRKSLYRCASCLKKGINDLRMTPNPRDKTIYLFCKSCFQKIQSGAASLPSNKRHCALCGTTKTPQWRKIENAEHITQHACNACGLDYKKQQKKRERHSIQFITNSEDTAPALPTTPSPSSKMSLDYIVDSTGSTTYSDLT